MKINVKTTAEYAGTKAYQTLRKTESIRPGIGGYRVGRLRGDRMSRQVFNDAQNIKRDFFNTKTNL